MISIEKKSIFLIILLGITVATFINDFFGHKSDLKQAIIEENNLEIELRQLNVLPEAQEVRHSTFHKEGLSSVYTTYLSSKSYNEIRSYFLEEAPKNGWVFVEEKPVTKWGKDSRVKELSFKKNDYQLFVTYQGEETNKNETFIVNTYWSIWRWGF